MAKFFIDRPIFAWVIALVIMLAGALSILKLPVSQYPSIAPPSVTISANYPGASAQTLQDTVTQVIEQQMKGIYTTSVNMDTLDECPMAYKDMKDIVDNIGDTADIEKVIRPIYNFKAGT